MLLSSSLYGCAGDKHSSIGVPGATGEGDTETDAGSDSDAAADALDGGSAEGGDGGPGAAAAPPPPPKPDPTLVKMALDRTGQPAAIEAAPYGLRFEVVEQGPELPWAYAVVNRGSEPMRVALDPRLLRFELEPAPPEETPEAKGKRKPIKAKKPKKRECTLPTGIRPGKVDKKTEVVLAPGEGIVETFDPRLYCLPIDGKSPFDPGVTITAHLGFVPKTKTVWRKGKKVDEPVPQTSPFVAVPAEEKPAPAPPPEPPPAEKTKGKKAKVEPPPEEGAKELVGTAFALGADYDVKPPPSDLPPPVLDVVLSRGSDANSEESATITVQIKNRSKEKHQIFFRRELVSFEVSGPDGRIRCDPQPDGRAPDRQAFRTLTPGGVVTTTSRLIELCPDDTFARPGLYLAHARFDASASGSEFGFEAVIGKFASEKPAVIRIRTGELPFLGTRVMERVKVGSAPP